jgi:hypothetical protein
MSCCIHQQPIFKFIIFGHLATHSATHLKVVKFAPKWFQNKPCVADLKTKYEVEGKEVERSGRKWKGIRRSLDDPILS